MVNTSGGFAALVGRGKMKGKGKSKGLMAMRAGKMAKNYGQRHVRELPKPKRGKKK